MKAEYALLYMKKLDIDFIKKEVASMMNMSVFLMEEKTRKREIVIARQLSMALSKKYTKESLASIGYNIGRKDHATVLHACRTINDLIDTKDETIRNLWFPLDRKLARMKETLAIIARGDFNLFVNVNEELVGINELNDN